APGTDGRLRSPEEHRARERLACAETARATGLRSRLERRSGGLVGAVVGAANLDALERQVDPNLAGHVFLELVSIAEEVPGGLVRRGDRDLARVVGFEGAREFEAIRGARM